MRDAWGYRLPTGVRAVFEDVIVDEEPRGLGAGAALVQDLMDQAQPTGARGFIHVRSQAPCGKSALGSNGMRAASGRLLLLRVPLAVRATSIRNSEAQS